MSRFAFLVVDADVRYWEDATVNGVQDDEGTLIPFREGDSWRPVIDLASGRIKDWPEGTTADIHYKVCDAGQYWLADADGVKVAKWADYYVPDDFLAGGKGWGDYIILKVGCEGMIEGWRKPDFDMDEWKILRTVGKEDAP